MQASQAIREPFGVTVFGSSLIRVEPDVAALSFSVSNLKQKPKDAFQEARANAQKVRSFLASAQIADVGSSRVTLTSSFRYTNGENRFVGYAAKVSFHVLLRNLDLMEEILVGVVDAGANEIGSVELQTTQLKAMRQKVREQAIHAAQEKAEVYSAAAGVRLGAVVHIEDLNPDRLRGNESHHVVTEPQVDEEGPLRAIDPGSIVIGGAVLVSFRIET